jgi:hypothetical protein
MLLEVSDVAAKGVRRRHRQPVGALSRGAGRDQEVVVDEFPDVAVNRLSAESEFGARNRHEIARMIDDRVQQE